jgi:hypothetical protein
MNLKGENPSELFRAGFFPEDPEAVKKFRYREFGGAHARDRLSLP